MNLEVSLNYNSRSKGATAIFLLAWLVAWILALLSVMSLLDPRDGSSATGYFAIFGAVFAFVPLVSLAHVHTQIVMNELAVRVPHFALGLFAQQRKYFWRDLTSVSLSNSKKRLKLQMKDRAHVEIQLNKLNPTELEKLLLAIDSWAPHCIKSAEVSELQHQFIATTKEVPTLTQMWEEEFNRRYSPAAFIPLEPGALLQAGTIRIVKQLSFGGFSAIYIAQQASETIVIKELAINESCDRESRDKARSLFSREAKILRALDHADVVKLFDHFEEDGRDYVALEYVAGPNLRQAVRVEGALRPERVAEIAKQMLEILAYFRMQDPPLIHRDLSPDNVILLRDRIKILDFGAANEFIGTVTGTVIGKASYMAPEQVRGKAVPATDIYGLGATMYFLLTGQDPEPLTQIDSASLGDKVPDQLRQLIGQMTNLDPSARPDLSTIAQVIDTLAPVRTMSAKQAEAVE